MKQVLSKEQQDIAFFNECEGAILVEASAGSGKTRILTERVRHLLTEKKDKFFSILCLTFTNKAADEMKERLHNVSKLKERAFIGNFHDFCLNDIIRTNRNSIGLNEMPHIFDEKDRRKIIEEVLYMSPDLKSIYEFPNANSPNERAKEQQNLISKSLRFISEAKRNLIVIPDDVILLNRKGWTKQRTFLYKNYNYKLENQNAIDYDDILLYAYRILVERSRTAKFYRQLYKYILVDEAQDLNYAQYQILRAICGDTHNNVMMVGDPKQAIYAFNGASPDFMQKDFIADFQAVRKEIAHNYRSSTKVLKLAHHIQPNGGTSNNYFEGIHQIKSFKDEKEEAEWVIQEIKKWLKQGYYQEEGKEKLSINIENIAVLSRTRYIFKDLINLLEEDSELKNKFHLRKGSEKFEPETHLMKIFDWGLRVIINPLDILHFNQIYQLLNLQIPIKGERLKHLLELDKNEDLSSSLRLQIEILTESWKLANTNPKRLDIILEKIKQSLEELELSDEEKGTILFDIYEFEKLWRGFLMNTPSNKQNLNNFRYFLAMKSVDQNKKGITLSTIHTVKGLEFEIVFLIGMNNGILPFWKATTKRELAEERNNAYVAITRAKYCIYTSYPNYRTFWEKPRFQQISKFIKGFKE